MYNEHKNKNTNVFMCKMALACLFSELYKGFFGNKNVFLYDFIHDKSTFILQNKNLKVLAFRKF